MCVGCPLAGVIDTSQQSELVEIGQVLTTATLERIGVEALRYRPNLAIANTHGLSPYAENDSTGWEFAIGIVQLRGLKPTPRCVVPTLEHGPLPRAPRALRALRIENSVTTTGSTAQPSAGAYLEVAAEGRIRVGHRADMNL